MTRWLLTMLFSVAASLAQAHVGSPNVFFEGRAGAYPVYAVIRPPAALPGAAEVSVRVHDNNARSVSLRPLFYTAGRKGAPLRIQAMPVSGQPNMWSAQTWFLRAGSYTLQIDIDGAQGPGEVSVPVNIAAITTPNMPRGLVVVLVLVGLVLVVSAVAVARAIASQGTLESSQIPARMHRVRGRRAGAVTFALLMAATGGGAVRWRTMDRAYRINGLQKPEPVTATVRAEPGRQILEVRQTEFPGLRPSWSTLVPDHGKLMHLFLIREPQLDVFAHLHPVPAENGVFDVVGPPIPAGTYQLYGDLTFENGLNQTIVARVDLPQPTPSLWDWANLRSNSSGEPVCGSTNGLTRGMSELFHDLDDSWCVHSPYRPVQSDARGASCVLPDGYTLVFLNAEDVNNGKASSLQFAAFGPDGRPAPLQPYMGMLGHAALRRFDGSVFAHLHPAGTFSMASQAVFRQQTGTPPTSIDISLAVPPLPPALLSNQVAFPYQLPKPGNYRLWVQTRIGGKVLTATYDLESKPGT